MHMTKGQYFFMLAAAMAYPVGRHLLEAPALMAGSSNEKWIVLAALFPVLGIALFFAHTFYELFLKPEEDDKPE